MSTSGQQSPGVLVLLAEDDNLVALNFVNGLEDAGYQVTHVADGRAAIETLDAQDTNIRALVTDIRMGNGPDGWAVAKHARTLDPVLPVIYASGDSADQWPVQGVPNSVMLQKPFAIAQLVTAVSTLINEAQIKDVT